MTIVKADSSMESTTSNITLFGFDVNNCCKKNQHSEKVSNALLPISFGIYSQKHNIPIQLCSSDMKIVPIGECFYEDTTYDTEKSHNCVNFKYSPPNDVCITRNTYSVYYESKVVMSKGSKTELILRQDCYAFNCLQHIIVNNASKTYRDIESLLCDTLVEQPYLWMLLWEKRGEKILFDCVVFTDVAVVRMIKNSTTERTKEAIKLINRSLQEYHLKGTMAYKDDRSSTVAHQKVSLFPIRDIKMLSSHNFEFRVKSTDIVIKDVRSDTSLWQEIEKARLNDRIRELTDEVERLKKKCGE